jgi:hypothetical protein
MTDDAALFFDESKVPVEVIAVANDEAAGPAAADFEVIGEKFGDRVARRPGSDVILKCAALVPPARQAAELRHRCQPCLSSTGLPTTAMLNRSMPLSSVLAFLLGCFAGGSTGAQAASFENADDFLRNTIKKPYTLVAAESGDVNGDGREDWVGIVQTEGAAGVEGDPPARMLQLFVLSGSAHGGFTAAGQSGEHEVPHPDCCELTIAKSSLYIKTYEGNYSSGAAAATHQFKWRQGQWQLIGQSAGALGRGGKSTDISINYLTGEQIAKEGDADGRSRTIKTRKSLGTYLLKDYDFTVWFGR